MFAARTRCLIVAGALAATLTACGGGSSGETPSGGGGGPAGGSSSTSSGDGFTFTSSSGRPDVDFTAEEAAAGLATVESTIGGAFETYEGAKCWMIVREDGTSPTNVRCGPKRLPSGELSWGSVPVAGERDSDGVFSFDYHGQADAARFPGNGVELVRPDGLEAPEEAYSDAAYAG